MNIVLCCSAGMSTSLLMSKMLDHAKKKNIDVSIKAVSVATVREHLKDVDILLLGPQVKFEYDNLKPLTDEKGIKLSVIDMKDYGMMKGDKVLEDVLKL